MRVTQDIYRPYVPAAKTNILETFRRKGWMPPSESAWYQEKWATYRHLAKINEEALK